MVSFLGISDRMVSAACVGMALLLFFAGMTMSRRSPFYGVLFIILSLLLLFAGLIFLGKIRG